MKAYTKVELAAAAGVSTAEFQSKILPSGAIFPKLRSLNAANMQKNAPKINFFAILFAYLHFL